MNTGHDMDRRPSPSEQERKPVRYEIPEGRRISDLPARLRPREEVERRGVRNVSDDVLLAVVLRSGVRGVNVVELSRQLLSEFGTLTSLADASVEELAARRGMGKTKSQVLKAALELARRLNEEAAPQRTKIRTPADAAKIVRADLAGVEKEVFRILLLDTKNRIKSRPVTVSEGLLDASLVHPREVFREAIRSAAAAVVLTHNHPSGDPTPSAEDLRITKQLVDAGRIIDIKVLDHVIVGHGNGNGEDGYVSLREEGLVSF